MKKDAVIQNKTKMDVSGGNSKNTISGRSIKKLALVSDGAQSELNSKRNFNLVTRLIFNDASSVVVDSVRMLNFENSLQDEVKVNNFTDNLLTSIKDGSATSKAAKPIPKN